MSDHLQEPRASVDHFIGRVALDVFDSEHPPWKWVIQLEGGIIISNKDAKLTDAPFDVKGKQLLFVALGETDTRLQFGNVRALPDGTSEIMDETWVTLNPTKYTLGGFEGQTKEFYPQMPEELEDVLPPDPSPERIVDGPQKQAQEVTGEAESDGEE